MPNIEKYFDNITVGPVAKPEAWLKYKPVPAGVSLIGSDFIVGTVVPGGALTTFVASPDLVDAAGKWHVTANGKLITFTPIMSAQLTYKPSPVPDIDNIAQSTVIPDPFTDTTLGTQFNGLKLVSVTGGYLLYLPPRMPLLGSRKIAQSPDHSGNQVGNSSPRYFFQDRTLPASADIHYRYKFPNEIQDIVDAPTAVSLPDNFMYLVDTETGTIIEGLAFSADPPSPSYIVKVTGSALDSIVTETPSLLSLSSTDVAADYKSRFRLMCPGNSLARAQAGLSKLYFNHTHIGADGSLPLSHSQLLDLYNSNSPDWEPSSLKGDDHPQYLHRDGVSTRDNLKNGMRGDLLLLANNNTVGLGADSYKLRFGSDTGPFFNYNLFNDAVNLEGRDLRIVTGIVRLNDMYLERAFSGRVVLHNGTQINDQELLTGKITVSSATNLIPGGSTTLTLDSAVSTSSITASGELHVNASANVFVDNNKNIYFPSGTTETDVFLNRSTVSNLSVLQTIANAQKAYFLQWGDATGKTRITTTFLTIASFSFTVPAGTQARVVVNATTNFKSSQDGASIGFTHHIGAVTPEPIEHIADFSQVLSSPAKDAIYSVSFTQVPGILGIVSAGAHTLDIQFNRANSGISNGGTITLLNGYATLMLFLEPV